MCVFLSRYNLFYVLTKRSMSAITKTEKKLVHCLRDYIRELVSGGGGSEEKEKEKKVKSPYLFFCDDKRAEVVALMLQENPDMKVIRSADVLKEFGKIWKVMPDTDKQKYVDMADNEKARRKTALATATPEVGPESVTE